MEEWKEYKLGELCVKIGSGATPKGGKEAYLGGDISLIRSQNVLDFTFSNDGLAFINDEQANKLKNVEVKENDVLLNITGDSVARACIVPNSVLPARVNQHVAIIRGDESLILNKFILYALQYKKQYLLSISQGGGTRNALTKKMIEDFVVSLPSIATQQKIANILSSLDDKIEVNRRINEQLEELAQTLFKSWFVDFEPFKDGEFVESEFVKLGDVVKTTSGGTPSRKHMEYYGGNHGWVKSKELNGTFIIDTEETITDDAIAKSSAKMLPAKSILIAMYGATVGQYAILSKPMTCNQAVCALVPNDNYPYTYLFMFAKNKKEELVNKAVGSAQQNISQVLIKDLDVSNDIGKIKKFHLLVNPMFETIEKNQQEITHLTNLRDTLLPKLMSGDIEV